MFKKRIKTKYNYFNKIRPKEYPYYSRLELDDYGNDIYLWRNKNGKWLDFDYDDFEDGSWYDDFDDTYECGCCKCCGCMCDYYCDDYEDYDLEEDEG